MDENSMKAKFHKLGSIIKFDLLNINFNLAPVSLVGFTPGILTQVEFHTPNFDDTFSFFEHFRHIKTFFPSERMDFKW